jgi:hypothetical protein
MIFDDCLLIVYACFVVIAGYYDRQCKPYTCQYLLVNTNVCVNPPSLAARGYTEGNVTVGR